MGKGKDKAQRKRRAKTDEEKAALVRRKDADRRKKEAERREETKNDCSSVASFFTRVASDADGVDLSQGGSDSMDLEDESDMALEDDLEVQENEDDGVVTFTDLVDPGCDEDDPNIVANLDIDEDSSDIIDDGAEAEPVNAPVLKWKRGVHQDYMRALNDCLKIETSSQTKGLEAKWLLNHLKANGGWVKKEQAESVIQQLRSPRKSPSTYSEVNIKWQNQNRFYYRDVFVYIPDILNLPPTKSICANQWALTCHFYRSQQKRRINFSQIAC